MMDDDNSDWLSAATEEPPVEEAPKPAAPRGKREAAGAEGPALAPPTEVTQARKKLNKHWARPIFLHYNYIYTYMHNYYDDYIEYLDRRQRGFAVEPPRAQTWAERALRSYARDTYPFSSMYRLPRKESYRSSLLNTPHWANTWHSEHSKDYYNRKYKSILF